FLLGSWSAASTSCSSPSSDNNDNEARDATEGCSIADPAEPAELACLRELVPLDDNGSPTSIGSLDLLISECSRCVLPNTNRARSVGFCCYHGRFLHTTAKAASRFGSKASTQSGTVSCSL
ncbi:unnamed protein product, partial [Polarella glacialis]